jgi:hypothetical protein
VSDPLTTYLHDHLAGAVLAIQVLETMRKQHVGEPIDQFAASLLVEIEADRDLLRGLADSVGAGSSGLKEMGAWLGEKLGRLKLTDYGVDSFGTFEALEFLGLGIHGKSALWHALAVIAESDTRLQATDFDRLAARAESQEAQVERWRLDAARTVFRSAA